MIALILGGVFTFDGSSASALVDALQKSLHKTVIAVVDPERKLEPIKTTWDKERDLLAYLGTRLKLETAPNSQISVSGRAWPNYVYFGEQKNFGSSGYTTAFPKDWGDRLNISTLKLDAGGQITGWTGPMGFSKFEELTALHWSCKISVHWFYRRVCFGVSAVSTSQENFWKAVANSVGAVFHAKEKELALEFSPKTFRSRAVKTLEAFAKTSEGSHFVPELQFSAAVISQATDDQLRYAYEFESMDRVIEVLNTPVIRLALLAKINSAFGVNANGQPTSGSATAYKNLMENVDWNKPFRARFTAYGLVLASLPDKQPNKWHEF